MANRHELLGDKVERTLKKIGVDKAAKVYEKVTKKPCGCQKRKKKLNDLHLRLRKAMERNKRSR